MKENFNNSLLSFSILSFKILNDNFPKYSKVAYDVSLASSTLLEIIFKLFTSSSLNKDAL